MPVYNYRCKDCKHEFEATQSMKEDSISECPECKGFTQRIISNVGVTFKCSGFYVNS